MKTLSFFKGPSLILNSGSLNYACIATPDKFNKFSTYYVVGKGNRSFKELKRIVNQLIEDSKLKATKMPWLIDETTSMVSVFASSKNPVPVIDGGAKTDMKQARDGDFCKINVTPAVYEFEEVVSFRLPDGTMGQNLVKKTGVNLYLNGVMLLDTDQDLF